MAFQIFTDTRSRSAEFISLNESQAFGFSRSFLDKHGITKEHKAVIMYDADENKIAIQFVAENVKHGFAVQINSEKHGAIVKAKSFFDRMNIDAGLYSRRYNDFERVRVKDLGIDQDGEAFVIQLRTDEVNGQLAAEGGESRQSADVFLQSAQ
jgi:hypothetical protein